jgi:hypothetical protein
VTESITLIFLIAALVIASIIAFWAALTLPEVVKSNHDSTLFFLFSIALPALLLGTYIIRRFLYPSYMSVALIILLVMVGWAGTLILCLCGIKFILSAQRHGESFVKPLMGTLLSSVAFVGSCIVIFKG